MAASEENNAMFPIFILTIMALPVVPYTITKLCSAASKKTKTINCQCSECSRSGKYNKSIFKRISNFSTCSNLTLVLLLAVMIFLIYYIKNMSSEVRIRILWTTFQRLTRHLQILYPVKTLKSVGILMADRVLLSLYASDHLASSRILSSLHLQLHPFSFFFEGFQLNFS